MVVERFQSRNVYPVSESNRESADPEIRIRFHELDQSPEWLEELRGRQKAAFWPSMQKPVAVLSLSKTNIIYDSFVPESRPYI